MPLRKHAGTALRPCAAAAIAFRMSDDYYALYICVDTCNQRDTMRTRPKLKKVNVRKLREELGINQSEFWGHIEVTQSGGSRFENGRSMPGPVCKLLGLVYLKEKL